MYIRVSRVPRVLNTSLQRKNKVPRSDMTGKPQGMPKVIQVLSAWAHQGCIHRLDLRFVFYLGPRHFKTWKRLDSVTIPPTPTPAHCSSSDLITLRGMGAYRQSNYSNIWKLWIACLYPTYVWPLASVLTDLIIESSEENYVWKGSLPASICWYYDNSYTKLSSSPEQPLMYASVWSTAMQQM